MSIGSVPNFQPLSYSSFLMFYNSKSKNVILEPDYLYNHWLSEYFRKAIVFYQAFASWELKRIEREFKQYYGLDGQSIIEEYWAEWQQWMETSGATSIREEINEIIARMEYPRYEISKTNQDEVFRTPHDIQEHVDTIPNLSLMDELWFNTTIATSHVEQSELRELSYPLYLKSAHWKKVRLSVLLIQRAVCQAGPCWSIDESWYFGDWESDLHVHHLSYSNLGRERYRDVALLCSKHHDLWHAAQKRGQSPNFEIVY